MHQSLGVLDADALLDSPLAELVEEDQAASVGVDLLEGGFRVGHIDPPLAEPGHGQGKLLGAHPPVVAGVDGVEHDPVLVVLAQVPQQVLELRLGDVVVAVLARGLEGSLGSVEGPDDDRLGVEQLWNPDDVPEALVGLGQTDVLVAVDVDGVPVLCPLGHVRLRVGVGQLLVQLGQDLFGHPVKMIYLRKAEGVYGGGCLINNYPAIMFNSLFNKKEKEHAKTKTEPSGSFYEEETPKLPPNFAQSVMELEMQLEFIESYNMEVVQQLNELYRVAIQYYVNQDPRKANHFQKKLTSLLTHPYTLELIQKKETPAKQQEIDSAQYDSKLKMELNKFNTQSEVVIRSMIEGSNRKVEKSHRLMSDQLSTQEESLSRRMERRSRSKNRSQNKKKREDQ